MPLARTVAVPYSPDESLSAVSGEGPGAGMGIVRVIVIVVAAALLGWGGVAVAASPAQHEAPRTVSGSVGTGDGAADCHGTAGHHAGHYGDPAPDDDGAPQTPAHTHTGCCVAACSAPAVAGTAPAVGPVAWILVGVALDTGSGGRGRSVAPRHRPPRPAA